MNPVLKWIHTENPDVANVHIFSDGPYTQYKNKTNFFLSSHFRDVLGSCSFSCLSWNFFESAHGKGAADAVGGTLKRLADDIVNKGTDLPDAKSLFLRLTEQTRIQLFFVPDGDIKSVDDKIPPNLVTVKGTASIHQLITRGDGLVSIRKLSCFCHWPDDGICDCYQPHQVRFPELIVQITPTVTQIDQVVAADDERNRPMPDLNEPSTVAEVETSLPKRRARSTRKRREIPVAETVDSDDQTPCLYCDIPYCDSSVKWYQCSICTKWSCGTCVSSGKFTGRGKGKKFNCGLC
jgi:hypothetical protein